MAALKNENFCPQCEKGKLGIVRKNLAFKYKNRSKILVNEEVFVCDLCDYEGLTHDDNERIDRILIDFRKNIDGLLSCDNVKSIRQLKEGKTRLSRKKRHTPKKEKKGKAKPTSGGDK